MWLADTTKPFWTPSSSHRPRATRRAIMLKAWAAAAMETLMEGSAKKLAAAETVAGVSAKAGYRLPGKKLPRAKTVAGWRNQFIGHSGGSEGAREFKKMLAIGREQDADLAIRAKVILAAVELLAKSI